MPYRETKEEIILQGAEQKSRPDEKGLKDDDDDE